MSAGNVIGALWWALILAGPVVYGLGALVGALTGARDDRAARRQS